MLLKSIQRNSFGVIFLVLIAIGLVWTNTLLGNFPTYRFLFDSFPMPLYKPIADFLGKHQLWSNLLSLFLFLISGFYLLNLNTKHIITKSRNYFPLIFFLFFSAAFIPIQRLNPGIFSLPFILLSIDHLLSIYQKQNALDNIFRAGLSIGIATLFYPSAVVVAVWAVIALLVLRAFRPREMFVLFVSFTVPWLLYMSYLFIINDDIWAPYHTLIVNLFTEQNSDVDQLLPILFFSFMAITLWVSILNVFPRLTFQKIVIRRYFSVLLYLMLIGVASFLLIPGITYDFFYIISIPTAYILSSYFNEAKSNFWNELLLWLPILGAVLIQIILII